MSDAKAAKPGPLPADVLTFFRSKGYKFGWSWADTYGEEHQFQFTVAKVMRADVLELIRTDLTAAIDEGVPFEQWRRDIKPKLEAAGWWAPQQSEPDPDTGRTVTVNPPTRLANIYRTNMRSARAVGQQDRMQRNKKSRPFAIYTLGASKEHRLDHAEWAGIMLPIDDPWFDTHTPPLGYGCNCQLRSVSAREAESLLGTGILAPNAEPVLDDAGNPTGHVLDQRIPVRTKAPPIEYVNWTNPRTGATKKVPKGVQPGFEFRPGEARRRAIKGE